MLEIAEMRDKIRIEEAGTSSRIVEELQAKIEGVMKCS